MASCFNILRVAYSVTSGTVHTVLSNKRGGGAKVAKSINVEVGILQLESSPLVFKYLAEILG